MILILIGLILLFPLLPIEYIERAQSIVNLEDISIIGRLDGIVVGSWIMKDHPFLGVGMGNWPIAYFERAILIPELQTKFSWFPHNLFVEIGSQMGFFALCCYVMFYVHMFKDLAKAKRIFIKNESTLMYYIAQIIQISFIGFLICAAFAAGVQLKIFWMLAGFALALKQLSMKEDSEAKI